MLFWIGSGILPLKAEEAEIRRQEVIKVAEFRRVDTEPEQPELELQRPYWLAVWFGQVT